MKSDRDIDKVYPLPDFVAKLRRLADALEAGEQFDIQIAGERIYVPSRAIFSIEHEREEGAKRSNSSCAGSLRRKLATKRRSGRMRRLQVTPHHERCGSSPVAAGNE